MHKIQLHFVILSLLVYLMPTSIRTAHADYHSTSKGSLSNDSRAVEAFRARLMAAWKPAASQTEKVTVRFSVGRDGKVLGTPKVISSSGRKYALEVSENIIAAIYRAQPYTMFPLEKYQEWKELEVIFDPSDRIAPTEIGPIEKWCRKYNLPGHVPNCVQDALSDSKKLKQITEEEKIDAKADIRLSVVHERMLQDVRNGYRYMSIKEYSQSADKLADGIKIAVAAQLRGPKTISDVTKLYRGSVILEAVPPEAQQKVLSCLKVLLNTEAPCPMVFLGITHHCSRTSFGIDDGLVPCIVVSNLWSFYEISEVWTGTEVWALTPVESFLNSPAMRRENAQR